MDQRGQFTFYASIFESAKRIRNKAARADFYDAVCDYALNGIEPNLDKLSDAAAIGFISAKPNLDASRKKAKSGKAGGSSKQTVSKPQANGKQTASEKENEKEVEIENEIENECYISGDGDDDAREATADELSLIGLVPGVYHGITTALVTQVVAETESLVQKHMGRGYVPADCRNVCQRVLFGFGKGLHIDKQSLVRLDYAFDTAASAGHAGEWAYVHGIMDRLAFRGITTVQQAIAYDMDRPDKEDEYDS